MYWEKNVSTLHCKNSPVIPDKFTVFLFVTHEISPRVCFYFNENKECLILMLEPQPKSHIVVSTIDTFIFT